MIDRLLRTLNQIVLTDEKTYKHRFLFVKGLPPLVELFWLSQGKWDMLDRVWECRVQCTLIRLTHLDPSPSLCIWFAGITSGTVFEFSKIQSNLPKWSPLLSSHLHLKVIFFLSCHRKFHINWTSFRRLLVLKDQFFFVPKVTS